MQGLTNATSTGYLPPMGAPMFSPHASLVNTTQMGFPTEAYQGFAAPQGLPPFNGSITYPPMQGAQYGQPPAFTPGQQQHFNVVENLRNSLLSSSAANLMPQPSVITSMIQPANDFQITETVVNAPRRSITRIFPRASYSRTETTFVPTVGTVHSVVPEIRRSVGYSTVTPLVAPTITTERVIRRSVSSYRTSPPRVSVTRVFPVTQTVIEPMVSSVYVPTTTTVTYPARSSVVSTSYVETGSFI